MKQKKISMCTIDGPVNLLTLPESNWTAIATDWYGNPLPFTWKFFIAVDSTLMHFFTRSTAPIAHHPDAVPGTFIPGLWQYTVAELFLFRTGTDAYHEFNVAPDGAWWHSRFTGYRAPDSEYNSAQLAVTPLAHRTPSAWIAGISFPRSLTGDGTADDLRIAVCGIVGHEAQTFIAHCPDSSIEPDFHLKRLASGIREMRCQNLLG